MTTVSYRTALPLLKITAALNNCFLVYPILLLLYNSKGLTTGEFFLTQGLYCFIIVFLEIPTGYIGDIFSRKKVLLAAIFFNFTGYIYLIHAQGLAEIILFEIIAGISACLISGTIDSYLYDVLEKLEEEEDNLKHQGELNFYQVISLCLSGVIGGFIFTHNNLLPIYITSIMLFLGFIACLFLPDIKDSRRIIDTNMNKIGDIILIIKSALKDNEKIKWLIWYQAFLISGGFVIYWSITGLLEEYNFNPIYFGISFFIMDIIESIVSKSIDKITKNLGIKKISILLFLTMIIGFSSSFLLFKTNLAIVITILIIFLICEGILYGASKPLFTSLINRHVKSNERSTVLSIASMIHGLLSGIVFILMKPITDNLGLNFAIMFAGIFFLLSIIPLKQLCKKNII